MRGVTVDVQVGDGPTGSNPSIGQRLISFGEAWPIDAGAANVNYRRDLDPDHPTGEYGVWIDVPNYNEDVNVDV